VENLGKDVSVGRGSCGTYDCISEYLPFYVDRSGS